RAPPTERVRRAPIRRGGGRGHEPTPRPPGSALGVYGPLQPCRASVARRDHHRVCCLLGIASEAASFGILSRECQKRTGFSLLCQPSPNCNLRPGRSFSKVPRPQGPLSRRRRPFRPFCPTTSG